MIIADADERQAALDPHCSFIVQAPAGSGKTELLTQRFLKLLSLAQKAPEEILAVTFTRKAAGEMRHRILASLKKAKEENEPPIASHERTTWELARAVLVRDQALHWHLLQNPNRLRIFTIDALCSLIVNQSPILSQMGMMPEITDDPSRDYQEAITALLKETTKADPWSKSLQDLLYHLDNNVSSLFNLLLTLLASRDQWLPYIGQIQKNKTLLSDYLNNAILRVIVDHLSSLQCHFNQNLEHKSALLSHLRQAALACQEAGIVSPITTCHNLTELPETSPEGLPIWEGICSLLLTQQNTWRKSFTVNIGFPSPSESKDKGQKEERKRQKEGILNLVEAYEKQESLLKDLRQLRNLPHYPLSSQQITILLAIGKILPVLVAHLQLVFQQKAKVDFIEVSLSALTALGDELAPSELALKLDNQLRHLLIDEYQDTSVTQYRLFEKMIQGWQPGEGKTLFLVGDPMQSIYRFRGAEVSLFLHTQRQGLANIMLTPLKLSVNFRSLSPIVDWINQHFTNIFPKEEDVATGAISYSVATTPEILNSPHDEMIYLHPHLFEQDMTEKEILEIIQDCKNKGMQSVAILARSKRHLFPLIQLLKQEKVPFVAHEVEQLAQRSHVVDLLSLLRATQNLSDSIAWFAVLRAPWLGLGLADLSILAEQNNKRILWQILEEEKTWLLLSQNAQQRLARAVPLLQYWLKHQKRQKLSHWLRGLWIALGGPAAYAENFDIKDIDRVLDLIDTSLSMDGTLDIEALEEKLFDKLSDITILDNENTGFQLELMTIHKAKGLEFDCVIMPYLHKRARNRDEALLLWLEKHHHDGIDLLVAPRRAQKAEKDGLYLYVAEQLQQKDKHECARLLYVGTTRAKKALHLMLTLEQDKEEKVKPPPSGSFLSLLWPQIQESVLAKMLSKTDDNVRAMPKSEKLNGNLVRLKSHWEAPPLVQKVLMSHLEEQVLMPQNIPQVEETQNRAAGIVFHRLMQHIMSQSGEPELNNEMKTSCKIALKRLGLAGKRLEGAYSQVLSGLNNVISDPICRWLSSPSHLDKQREWALCIKHPQGTQQCVIDYTFVDTNNVRWIVDYKLSLSSDTTQEELEREVEKYKPQLKKYYQALRAYEDRIVKCGLYFPLIKTWKEVSFVEDE